ncbi:MAG TPA: DUF192 domain-containing protein [Actinomycetota bacterium]
MRQITRASVSLTLLAACADDPAVPSDVHPVSTVTFGGTDSVLTVDIADDPLERREGLMGIEELPTDQGMAFVWPGPVDSTFWMKDTLVPLSVAFVDESGRVIDVVDMQPCASDPCPSYGIDEPFVLAIEANLGWFDEHGVGTGDRAELQSVIDG